MPFAETSTGANLHYEHLNPESEKIPVVVLHGLLGTGRRDLGHVMDWLAEEAYEVFAPSLRGYGQSTPKPRDFPYKFYHRDAKDIMAFLDTLNIQQCHILGYSDGGEVALVCAGSAPERFVSVATIGSTGYLGPDIRPIVMGYRQGSQWISEEEMELHSISNPDQFAALWIRSMLQLIDTGGDVAVSLASNMTMPLLMILGDQDRLNPKAYAEKFMTNVADGEIVMFNAGHPVHDEQRDAFRKTYLAHLRQVESS